jgi:fibronectin type 3 domain-containing protein
MKEITTNNDCRNFSRMTSKGYIMNKLVKKSVAAMTILSMMTLGLMLAGCGGGSGGVSSEVVSGKVAVGAPLSGQVSLKDSSTPALQKSTVIGSDGSFAIDVTGMKAPYVLQATGSADGTEYKLLSFAEGTGTANINPLSNAIVAGAASDGESAAAGSTLLKIAGRDSDDDDRSNAYERSDSDRNKRIRENLEKTVSILLNKLEPLLKRYSAEHTNPITSRYIDKRLDMEDMFENVKITVSNGILSIINRKSGAVIFSGKVSDIANGIFDGGSLPPTADAPSAPAGLTAVGGTGQVTLTWTSVSNATSYNVYYATTSGVTTTSSTKITSVSTPYTQTGLTAGTTYFYIVTAVNSSGESPASNQASASTTATPPVPTVPAAPTGVIATGGTNQATISWSPVNTATSYNVYYATTSGVTKTNGTKITNATSPAVQTGLAAGTAYYYIVTAVNSVGESAASNQVAATTLAAVPTPTAPAAPAGVTAVGGANQATITWPTVSGAASYNVYWSTTTGVTKTNGTKVAGASSPYVKTGLSAGTTYYFIVTANNSVGESAASTQVTATTNAAPPAVPATPTGVTATGGANQVSVSWSAVSGATSYNIYWATTSGVTTSGTKITAATSPYVQTGLAASTTYYYIVTAVNASGQSVASAQVSAATNAPVVVIPAAPAGVTATGGANQVSISWSTVSGATSYNIYYATTSGVTKTSGAKIVNASRPYLQTGLAAGTTYYYIVTAVNSAGEGAASAQASAATNAPVVLDGLALYNTNCLSCHGTSKLGKTATAIQGAITANIGGMGFLSTLTTAQIAAIASTTATTPPPAPACGSCHAIPPSSGEHGNSNHRSRTCATCHGTGYSSTTVNAATHANGIINMATTIGWNASSRSCSNSCHGSKSW